MKPEEILQKQLVRLALIAPAAIILCFTLYAEFNWKGYWSPAPQPIPFPHKLHAEVRGIECAYCHRGSRDGYSAGVPSVQDCWACHRGITGDSTNGGPVNERPGVKILIEQYVNQRQDIKWFKYYDMPEHVKFAHKAHINAGFECTECHGNMAGMTEVIMKQKPTMGWCVSCHRKNGAPQDCTSCHR